MISMEQISGEIAALEEEKPTHVIMEKLANLYIVRDHMILEPSPTAQTVVIAETFPDDISGSTFMNVIAGKKIKDVLAAMDELMSTLEVLNPKLYNSIMRKVAE